MLNIINAGVTQALLSPLIPPCTSILTSPLLASALPCSALQSGSLVQPWQLPCDLFLHSIRPRLLSCMESAPLMSKMSCRGMQAYRGVADVLHHVLAL